MSCPYLYYRLQRLFRLDVAAADELGVGCKKKNSTAAVSLNNYELQIAALEATRRP